MNVLFLTHRVPDPPNRGDRIRAHHLLRFLAERCQVYLGCLADEPVAAATRAELEEVCTEVLIAPIGAQRRWLTASLRMARGRTATEGLFSSGELHRVIRNWARHVQFDAVVVYCSSMLQYAEVPELADVPMIVDLVDVDSQKWYDYANGSRGPKRWLYRLEAGRLRALEQSLPDRVRGITLVSELEAELFRSFAPNQRTYGVPNGVDTQYFQPAESNGESGQSVFLGVLDYRPNVEGLHWFCHHVWPQIHVRRPDLTFQMVGRRPCAAVTRLAELPGVELVGEVPDVRPYLQQADLVVAPLQLARGIQNKVLEALAAAKPVLATPQALEGLAVLPGHHVIEADSADQWASEYLRLQEDPAARAELGAHGRSYVELHHNWQACLQPFAQLLRLEPAVNQPAAQPGGNGASERP